VSFVDVGKGDCILVQSGGLAALIDTGYEETSDAVVSYLRERGVDRLECVVITHYDRDHIGGLRAVAQAFDIDTVYLPGYEGADKQYRSVAKVVSELELPTQPLAREVAMDLGAAKLTLYPTSLTYVPDANGDEGNDNDLSTVATLIAPGQSYLFAGDLEEEGIEAYLAAGHGSFDVVKMPHHGEKASNTDDLLDAARPQVAVITDAKNDPADKKTLKLLKAAGADVYRSSENGTIVVEGDGAGEYKVTAER
jgi:competence protein ComEC